MSRFLMRLPDLKPALALSAVLSALSVLGTVLGWTAAARLISAAQLRGAPPEAAALAATSGGLLLRALAQSVRDHLNAQLAARAVRYWRDRSTHAALRLGPVALASGRGSDLSLLAGDLDARLTPFYARSLPQAAHASVAAVGILAITLWLDP